MTGVWTVADGCGVRHSYGKSTGSPTESTIYAASKSAYQELQSRVTAPPSSTVILGRSMGGGVAVNLATQYSDVQSQGLILQSAYASLGECQRRHRQHAWRRTPPPSPPLCSLA